MSLTLPARPAFLVPPVLVLLYAMIVLDMEVAERHWQELVDGMRSAEADTSVVLAHLPLTGNDKDQNSGLLEHDRFHSTAELLASAQTVVAAA